MNFQEYINEMKDIQEIILDYFEQTNDQEYQFQNLITYFKEQQTTENKYKLKSLLNLILIISDNHQRKNDLYIKVFSIIKMFEEQIKKYFSNMNIFNVFKRNKLILLFLFEENIIVPTKSIFNIISSEKYKENFYPEFFYPEFKSISNTSNDNNSIEYNEFNQKRKKGENDNQICHFIQKDSINEFIVYLNKANIPINSLVKSSIFETNAFLLKNKNSTLIEYASFCGSIQIFKYLLINKAQLSSSLWLYAIHGNNAELIHLLEENRVKMPKDSLIGCFLESVKCHHVDLMNYFKNAFDKENCILYSSCFKFFNYIEIAENNDCLNELFKNADSCVDDSVECNVFYYLCKYDCCSIVDFLVKNEKVDINAKKIFQIIFLLI